MRLTNSVEHQKRFGQFFSGEAVASMLVSMLPDDANVATAIDPMAGVGDMLKAVNNRFDARIVGVEIDTNVAATCQENIPEAKIYGEDAFLSGAIRHSSGWDLVITNPPYVRYQLQGEDEGVMPSARSIRENLIAQLDHFSYLSDEEMCLFKNVARNYSGLADMAVPAWILCAAMVKMNGYLAVVVPETWLNREYAAPIQYLLGKCFKIKAISKETNERWFKNALVKTSLVLAQRCEIRNISALQDEMTTIITANKTQQVRTSLIFQNTLVWSADSKWISEEDRGHIETGCSIPAEMINALGEAAIYEDYCSLEDLGVHCGQGLRTGANDFFYLRCVEKVGDETVVESRAWDASHQYRIPNHRLVKTIQNRGQVDGLIADTDQLDTELLYIQSAVKEDAPDLIRYINNAEQYKNKAGKRFCELSAVRPNERIDSFGVSRFWYMLPELAKRHVPDLCMTRVNAGKPECIFVKQGVEHSIAVDANMVTLWGNNEKAVGIAFTLLNSTWCKCFLEHTCTVMGAGALKIEASHLKRLCFPKLNDRELDELGAMSTQLCEAGRMTPEIQESIDAIVGAHFTKGSIQTLRDLTEQKYGERCRRL